jgi:hypothetical protein
MATIETIATTSGHIHTGAAASLEAGFFSCGFE